MTIEDKILHVLKTNVSLIITTTGVTEIRAISRNDLNKITQELVKLVAIPDVTQQDESLINSNFAKYLAANYPTLLFDVTTAIESYTELINGG